MRVAEVTEELLEARVAVGLEVLITLELPVFELIHQNRAQLGVAGRFGCES